MSKELEALEYLKPFRWEDKMAKEAYETIKKSLTPTTSDEVCKALSEHLGCDVTYGDYGFTMDKDTSIRELANDKRFDLITLIGRFYGGVGEE